MKERVQSYENINVKKNSIFKLAPATVSINNYKLLNIKSYLK